MPVSLVEIPVLRFSYKFRKIPALKAGVALRYPVKATLLDRVSL
jgi:hypothetical protein